MQKYSRKILSKKSPINKQKSKKDNWLQVTSHKKRECSGKAGIQCLHEYLIFHISISAAWLKPQLHCRKTLHGSGEKSTHTKKIGSARIDFVV